MTDGGGTGGGPGGRTGGGAVAVTGAASGAAAGAGGAATAAVAAALLVLANGCGGGDEGGGGGPSDTASAKAKTVTARSTGLGKVLTGGQHKTLYIFEKDKGLRSRCVGGCAQAWPPMVVKEKPAAGGGGVRKGLLGTSKRKDGKTQVTYKGRPLYYYQGDQKASQTNGQGLDQFGAKWFALAPDGKEVKKKAKDGGGGGGY